MELFWDYLDIVGYVDTETFKFYLNSIYGVRGKRL